jgi:polyisoprenoid-binding protein YceI
MKFKQLLIALMASGLTATAFAAVDTYTIDPNHTYPSFEADHMGLSVLRGKYTKTSGTIALDRAAKTGSLDVKIDADSLDFGHEKLNKHAKTADMFDVAKFPEITYKSKSVTYQGDVPVSVQGELTLHGVTKPVTLNINKFKCIMHPMLKKEVCGADAAATFNRSDFGISFGLPRFAPEVKLAIEVEAVKN